MNYGADVKQKPTEPYFSLTNRVEHRMMSKPNQGERIVADGLARLCSTKEYAVKKAEARRKALNKYEPLLATAGFFGRLRLRLKMEREIRRGLNLYAPKEGLYLRAAPVALNRGYSPR